MPDLHTCVQRLLVSTTPDWETVSRWYWRLSEPHYVPSPELSAKVRELKVKAGDSDASIRALFRFVAQDIRYLGITAETEAPGYEPHDVRDTFAARHGVCRDKAALLVVMLREAGFADKVAQRMAQGSGDVVDQAAALLSGVALWAPSLLLSPFLAFFFLRDGHAFKRFISSAVPNAFFERTLALLHDIDRTLRAYFVGLMQLTVLDTVTLGLGLWLLGFPGAWVLGFICAVLAWVPYVGSILGVVIVVLVAATDFPTQPAMTYWAIGLFGLVRLLDDFVYMPLTIGKSLHMHPLITVVMLFAGGVIAGISGLMLVLPLLGVVMVIGTAIGEIVSDDRLMARYRHTRALRAAEASRDLILPK